LSRGEQDTLNPIGVNCIREFPGRGIRVWGARTLSSDGSWRYINVRRLFIVVAASLDAGLQWVVFEPNDRTLWAKVRRDVSSFLRVIWRSGALFGSSPDEAFYVKVDDENNPFEIRDLGQLIIECGLCPVKPAEFVILRLSQWAGPNAEA
jgi:phage tail sheath protein FI